MEVPRLHTAAPVSEDIAMQDDHPHPASTENTNVGRARRTGRPRRARKQPSRALSPSSARWQAWRQEHQGELEAVLKEHPGAYELFRQAVKTVPETLEEWLQSRVSWRPWVEWREQHQGPLHEVLADPEGWALFCQMRAQKNNPVNMPYEEWLLLPEQQQLITSVQWAAWRREHPGPQILALMLAAESPGGVEEGWQIYRSLRELKGESIPQSFEEWKTLPEIRRKAALSAWALWRQNHEGRLQDVLDDPEGWRLYSEMLALNPTGARSRSSRNRLVHEQNQVVGNEEGGGAGGESEVHGDEENVRKHIGGKGSVAREARRKWMDWRSKNRGPLVHVLKDAEGWAAYRAANDGRRGYSEMPTTYEEWVQKPEQQLTLATLAWIAWREQHQGKLPAVLADPEGWALFRNLNRKSLIVGGRTAHTADGNVVKLKTNRRGGDKAKRSRRKATPSTFATAAATPVTTATTTTTSVVLGGDDGNDEVELKGGSSTADEEQQQAGNTAAEESTCLLAFPETYEDWLTWRRGKSRRSAVRGSEVGEDDGLAAHKSLEKRWQQWRVEHPGPLEEVLAAEPEGWDIYSAYICRNGQKAYFTDFNSWLEVQVTRRAWPKWREQHPGALAVALRNSPEGWPLYRAHIAGLSITSAAVHGTEHQKPPLPETLQEWLQQPAQIVQMTADAWNVWRQAHPGPLLAQLTEQVAVGQEEPCGWLLLRVLLQFYVCAAGTSVESEKSVTDTEQAQELPDTLEAFVLDLKRSSRAAWLRWAQQQRRTSLQVRLRDPVGWALYKVMRESDGAAPEFAVSYEDWMQKRAEKARAAAGHGNNSAASGGTAGSQPVSQGAGRMNSASAGRQGGAELNAVSAWSRWRRQRRGELLTVLQEHARGWQLYCNMLAARNKPVPESFAAFKESRERDQRQMQTEAAAQWELWRQEHAGPLEEVLADRQGAVLYTKMIETSNRSEMAGNNVKRFAVKKAEKAAQWLVWREQHPGPLEVVFAEHPESVELHCAWLAAETAATGPGGGKKGKPRGRSGRGTHSEKEATRCWREWRMQHPGPLQQVLAADLAAAAERGQTEVAVVGEPGVRMAVEQQQQQQQRLQAEGGCLTGWQLFCAHAASQGRQMPQSFQEWLQQPQQIAQREFGVWRAAHPGLLVDVLRDQEGWQLYVKMKRAAATAAAEEGIESPEVVEHYSEWVERERLQREQQSKRRNRRVKAEDRQGGTEEGHAERTYHCEGFTTGDRVIAQSEEGCHGVHDSVFGSAQGPA